MTRHSEAVVVNYNAGRHLARAVETLLAEGVGKVWVVDNGSTDGSAAIAADSSEAVEVLVPGGNLGYGKGANFGFDKVRAPYVIICNPDIEVETGAVSALVEEMDGHPGCAVVGPRIVNSDGTTYPSPRRFPSLSDSAFHALLGQIAPGNRFTRRYRMSDIDHSESFDCDWVSGAFLLVRRDAFKEVGGFDDSFFMYLEDVYLCRTMWESGYSVRFCGRAGVRHVQGLTTARRPLPMIFEHHRSLWVYASLTRKGIRRVELIPIGMGIGVRLALSVALALAGWSLEKPKVELD